MRRTGRAKLLARRGEHERAELLVREAIELGHPTDHLEAQAESLRDLAIVLAAAGRHGEATDGLDCARPLYEEKGHTVGVARIEELRSELAASLEA